jgi:hypothetical protein
MSAAALVPFVFIFVRFVIMSTDWQAAMKV